IHHRFVRPENILGAVAVVDVEIDDRSTLGAVGFLSVAGGDCRIVEKTESHRPGGFGVVSRWTRGDESIRGLAGHYLIDSKLCAADRAKGSLETARRHRSI